MVTKDQAMTETHFHYGECKVITGPKGGVRYQVERWRANGKCKVWKTHPDQYRLPIKFGLRAFSSITPGNEEMFHVASECSIEELRGW